MLFNETTISGIVVKNRIIRSATHDGLADGNGAPSDKLIAKYEHLAMNEIGCIITGYAAVSRNGVSPYPRMIKIYDDGVIDKYKELKADFISMCRPFICKPDLAKKLKTVRPKQNALCAITAVLLSKKSRQDVFTEE